MGCGASTDRGGQATGPSHAAGDRTDETLTVSDRLQHSVAAIEQLRAILDRASARAADAANAGETWSAVSSLQEALVEIGSAGQCAYRAISELEPKKQAASRSGYLVLLSELIGPVPVDRSWKDEFVPLLAEHYLLTGRAERANEVWVQQHRPLDKLLHDTNFPYATKIKELIRDGWSPQQAETYLLTEYTMPLGHELQARGRRFSASIYAVVQTIADLAEKRKGQEVPKLYWNLHGAFGLSRLDDSWNNVEVPDANGFCGVCSYALIKGTCSTSRRSFSEDARTTEDHPDWVTPTSWFSEQGFIAQGSIYQAQDSPVVCFESTQSQEGDDAMHTAVMLDKDMGVFPPNTLFRCVKVEPGPFEAPNGVMVHQRLITVRATFRSTRTETSGERLSKLCSSTLSYADRNSFVKGMEDVIARPPLSMEMEWSRDITWVDWTGVEYSVRREWQYVKGCARRTPGCTPGVRDDNNDEKSPEDFLRLANERVRSCRQESSCGGGSQMMDLSLEEVLALRLYSGPGFQPINEFLRQLAALKGTYREEVSRSPVSSFGATVRNICTGIRKLANISSPDEARCVLYRGVRGELPKGVWIPDESGLVCVVDTAFMSTSRNRDTPIRYMAADGIPNVLWELKAGPESDSAYHIGADISFLSQFAHEDEILFPPCTMMVVQRQSASATLEAQSAQKSFTGLERHENGATEWDQSEEMQGTTRFLRVSVRPHFV